MPLRLFTAILLLGAAPAVADVQVRFVEGAPKDRFIFTASDTFCQAGPVSVTVDLRGSAGALLFDVAANGSGVEVFQPLEIVAGGDALVGMTEVSDGDKSLTIELSELRPGMPFAFTIDVDDTLGAREITVSGSEIFGAAVTLASDTDSRSAVFGENAEALINWSSCQS